MTLQMFNLESVDKKVRLNRPHFYDDNLCPVFINFGTNGFGGLFAFFTD